MMVGVPCKMGRSGLAGGAGRRLGVCLARAATVAPVVAGAGYGRDGHDHPLGSGEPISPCAPAGHPHGRPAGGKVRRIKSHLWDFCCVLAL